MLDVTRLRVIDAVARHGSVTGAAKELHYAQPSVSHHLARLEAETGAQLLQRVGRGIRLTEAGRLLADRAAEIIGRIDAADAELAAVVGLRAGRVRLAGFSSVIGSLVPRAVGMLARRHPQLQISLTDTHPSEALQLLRAGKIDVALIFRYDESEPEAAGVRLHHLLEDPVYLLAKRRVRGVSALHDATWIAGCERCRSHLLAQCAEAGFEPRIGYTSDDMVVMQALVAAGLGVTTIPGLALRAHRIKGVVANALPGSSRQIYAATYGDPPDAPATTALLAALHAAAVKLAQTAATPPAGTRRGSSTTSRAGFAGSRQASPPTPPDDPAR
jgi:DNA-binding transcriptional LysR family regulator